MDAEGLIRITMLVSMVMLVFGLGLGSTFAGATYLFRRPSLFARSLIAMNVVQPLLVAWLVLVMDLRPAVRIALVALAMSPVPPFLPGKELKLVHGGEFTIGLFAAAALLAVVLVPASMEVVQDMGIGEDRVRAADVLRIVSITVLLPLISGMAVAHWFPIAAARIQPVANVVAGVLLFAAFVPILLSQWPSIRSLIGDGTLVAIAVATVLGLAVGHVLGGPNEEDRTVLGLATASRHPAVAMAIASASFPSQKLVPAAVLLALIVGAIVAVPYKAWRKRIYRRGVDGPTKASMGGLH